MTLSIIIPTHARAVLVRRAVESVLASTNLPSEIVVVEDRTSDAELALSDFIANGRLKYLRNTSGSSGASATRNFGVRHATGSHVLFLDDDDILHADYIEKLMPILSGSSVWGFAASIVDQKIYKPRGIGSGVLSKRAKFRHKLSGMGMGFWVKRDVYSQIGGLDPLQKVDEDTDLCCRLIAAGYDPYYLNVPATYVNRDGMVSRLSSSHDRMTQVGCYFRTLEKNYDGLSRDRKAVEFLVDRVHRVICKSQELEKLNMLKPYKIGGFLKFFQYLRVVKYKIKT